MDNVLKKPLEIHSLVYFVVGKSQQYANLFNTLYDELCKQVKKHNANIDVKVLLDNTLTVTCPEKDVVRMPACYTSQQASMRKLDVFDHIDTSSYDVVLFLDADILVADDLQPLLWDVYNMVEDIAVYTEGCDLAFHTNNEWFGLPMYPYSSEQLQSFKEQNICVFNAGTFAFRPSQTIKEDFKHIKQSIAAQYNPNYYEQCYMNVYYNVADSFHNKKITNRTIFNKETYIFGWKEEKVEGAVLYHLAGDAGNARSKQDVLKRLLQNIFKND